MRTVVVGNRKLARHLLRHTLENGWNVVGVLAPEGTLAAEQANYAPMEDLAEGTACSVHKTTDINSEQTLDWLVSVSPDICISGGWSQIVNERVLEVPNYAFLGFHSSRLPKGRGGAPVNWSLIHGNDEVWISLFHYVPGVDAGDVIARGSVPLEKRDDVATVFDALANEACDVLSNVREDLESGELNAKPQSLAEATYRPRRQPQDGLIDWNRDPADQHDWVRAQTDPYPGAYTFLRGTKLTVLAGEPLNVKAPADTAPGEVIKIVSGEGVDVRSGDGLFRVTRIRADDRPQCWADRYAQETGLKPGDRLGREFAPDTWCYTGIRGPEDPTHFETNLEAGRSGQVDLVGFSGSSHDIVEKVWLDGDLIMEKSVTIETSSRDRVEYAPEESGAHTLRVAFQRDGERVDTRFLKVFVH